ncbi:MAG: fibronectin type III domain-containing protein [Candidatus Nomurabacteria bacterium]|nr:fibronectin type III domain-containing protein [Candidatus Nomurabacteria bacterium]
MSNKGVLKMMKRVVGVIAIAILAICGGFAFGGKAHALANVAVSNADIYWSPGTWYAGTDLMQANSRGSYFKVNFSGTHFGVTVDTSQLGGIAASSMVLWAYIDSSSSYISKSLADVSGNEVVFSNSLSSGQHTATVYMSGFGSGSRWEGNPPNAFMINGIVLADGGATSAVVPNGKSVLFYGDSITDNMNGYAPKLGQLLGVEYGQLGYSGSKLTAYSGYVPALWTGNAAVDAWSNYSENKSRLSGGSYIGGTPTAIFSNEGINDTNGGNSSATLRATVAGWLAAERAATSANTGLYLIMPYNLGCSPENTAYKSTYPTYKEAYMGGYSDYTAGSSDAHAYLINLENLGCAITQNNSSDNLHPNAAGSQLIAQLIKNILTPRAVSSLTWYRQTESEIRLTWNITRDGDDLKHLSDGYIVKYRVYNSESDWTTAATLSNAAIEYTIGGLQSDTEYEFRVETIGTGLVDYAAVSMINTVTTESGGRARNQLDNEYHFISDGFLGIDNGRDDVTGISGEDPIVLRPKVDAPASAKSAFRVIGSEGIEYNVAISMIGAETSLVGTSINNNTPFLPVASETGLDASTLSGRAWGYQFSAGENNFASATWQAVPALSVPAVLDLNGDALGNSGVVVGGIMPYIIQYGASVDGNEMGDTYAGTILYTVTEVN